MDREELLLEENDIMGICMGWEWEWEWERKFMDGETIGGGGGVV